MSKNFFFIFIIISIITSISIICGCINDESTGKTVIIKGKDGTGNHVCFLIINIRLYKAW